MSPIDRGRGVPARVPQLLEQAERARRLSTILMDEDLCEILELVAREYEARARQANTEFQGSGVEDASGAQRRAPATRPRSCTEEKTTLRSSLGLGYLERLRAATSPLAVPTGDVGDVDPELGQRIVKALTHLPPNYHDILRAWANADDYVSVTDLCKQLGMNSDEMRASLATLSIRLCQVATPEELIGLRTPILLLVEIEYDESGSSKHRLTPAGRQAVEHVLAAL